MNRKRWMFGAISAVLTAGLFAAPMVWADHDDDDDDGGYRRHRYSRYRDYRGYDDEDDCDYRPRRTRYYRPRYTSRGYRCDDCGHRFGSPYWLRYHRRNSDCD